MNAKQQIIERFDAKVRGKRADLTYFNHAHDGKEGHWLELQMGITPNADNEADLFGYEMKKDTTSKTTFGDWSPRLAIWKTSKPDDNYPKLDRDTEFLKYFGKPNLQKEGRLSWSGEPVPTIHGYNNFGQILKVDDRQNILALYSFSEDKRINKAEIVPERLQVNNLVLAKWEENILRSKVENKFNQLGWFKCIKSQEGIYTHIGFGNPFNFESWIKLVREGTVFFDSGMYAGNKRPYSQWRAVNSWWDSLIVETY